MKDDSFLVQVNNDEKKQVLTFSGQLTINYIQKIKDAVAKQLNFSKDIEIKVENPDNLDITFLQLLQSLKVSFEQKQRSFSASAILPNELLSLISNAGFSALLNCNPVNE